MNNNNTDLLERVLDRDNMNRAWQRVRANKGAAGVDGVTIDVFPEWLRAHWPDIQQAIREGSCRPSPVRRVEIPKASGGVRLLGIPTVMDRVIQPREVTFRDQRGHVTGHRAGAQPDV